MAAVPSTLLTGIGELVTNDPQPGDGPLGLLRDAAVVLAGGRVAWVGPAASAPPADHMVEVAGRCVVPGFVDSHAHLVFAGDRGAEFAARMAGQPYAAGGIRTTVAATRAATDEELLARARALVEEMLRQGTTSVEIKSGYGLTVHDEARSLAVAATLTRETTFLGAHVVPPEHAADPAAYLELLTGPMLRACAPHARWVDAFCERGAFDADAARAVLRAGQAAGLGARVHANQLGPGPGARLAAEVGAASADHCTHLDAADVAALADARVVATLLPAAEFCTRSPYPDAGRLLAAGVTVALATDCNPGSAYTTSMPFCIALAVRELGMTPEQAVWSATAGVPPRCSGTTSGRCGWEPGQTWPCSTPRPTLHLAYRPGVPLVTAVWKDGRRAGAPVDRD